MTNLHNQFNEIEESLKYVGINATILARFVTPDKPLNEIDYNEVLDYYDNPHIKNTLKESTRDLLSNLDELADKLNYLKSQLLEKDKENIKDSLENIFNQE